GYQRYSTGASVCDDYLRFGAHEPSRAPCTPLGRQPPKVDGQCGEEHIHIPLILRERHVKPIGDQVESLGGDITAACKDRLLFGAGALIVPRYALRQIGIEKLPDILPCVVTPKGAHQCSAY